MKKNSIIIFRIITVLAGLIALAFLLIEPHFEGRNINANFWQIYFNDPFLTYAYLSSIPFFIILCQIYKMLSNGINFKSLKIIKNCALINIPLVLIGEIWISFSVSDDRAGGFFIGFLIILGSLIIKVVVSEMEKNKKD